MSRRVTLILVNVVGVRDLSKRFMIVKGEDSISKQANANATTLMSCLVRSVLCARKVIEEYRLSADAFEWILGEINSKFIQAQVQQQSTAFSVLSEQLSDPGVVY